MYFIMYLEIKSFLALRICVLYPCLNPPWQTLKSHHRISLQVAKLKNNYTAKKTPTISHFLLSCLETGLVYCCSLRRRRWWWEWGGDWERKWKEENKQRKRFLLLLFLANYSGMETSRMLEEPFSILLWLFQCILWIYKSHYI